MMQKISQANAVNLNHCKNLQNISFFSLQSLMSIEYDRYQIHWMEPLKLMIPNTVWAVPNFKFPPQIILQLN